MLPLEWSYEGVRMPGTLAAVASGQETPQGMDPSRNHHSLLTKEGRNRVGPPASTSSGVREGSVGENALLPPPPAYSLARSFCPGLRAMYQICLCPPGTVTASL